MSMKAISPSVEVWSVAVALMLAMLLAMWAQRPAPGCALAPEAPQRLILSREVDREHLARDLASARRVAQRYAASTPRDGGQDRRSEDCETTLIQQIANRHGVAPAQTRAW